MYVFPQISYNRNVVKISKRKGEIEMKITLEQLTVSGFKRFEDVFTTNFSEKNLIVDDNGKGKTSIADAISFAFTGKSVEGSSHRLNFVNNNSEEANVILHFYFNDEKVILQRTLNKVTNKMTIKWNGRNMTQKQLNEIIDGEMFLMLFNPFYFLKLDPTPARRFMSSILPTFSKDKVMNEMSVFEREVLENENFDENSPMTYIANRKKELKDMKGELSHQEGYIERVKQPLVVVEKPNLDEISKLKELIQTKEQEWFAMQQQAKNSPRELEKQIAQINNDIEQAKVYITPSQQRQNELQQLIRFEQEKLQMVTSQNFQNNDLFQKMNQLQSKKQNLLIQYQQVLQNGNNKNNEMNSLREQQVNTNCPTCNQTLTEQQQQNLFNERNKAMELIQNELNQLASQSQQLIDEGNKVNQELHQLKQEWDNQERQFLEQKTIQINEINQKIENAKAQNHELQQQLEKDEVQRNNHLINLNEQKKQLTETINLQSNQTDNKNKQVTLEKELNEMKQKLNSLETQLSQHELSKKQELDRQMELKRLMEMDIRFKKEIERTENLIEIMKTFASTKVQLLHDTISSYLNDVSIELQEVVRSTGEIKETFRIFYKEKPIMLCSLSEQIKAGQEVSTMIANLTNYECPLFIDNGESIQELDDSYRHQYIIAKVRQLEEDEDSSVVKVELPNDTVQQEETNSISIEDEMIAPFTPTQEQIEFQNFLESVPPYKLEESLFEEEPSFEEEQKDEKETIEQEKEESTEEAKEETMEETKEETIENEKLEKHDTQEIETKEISKEVKEDLEEVIEDNKETESK